MRGSKVPTARSGTEDGLAERRPARAMRPTTVQAGANRQSSPEHSRFTMGGWGVFASLRSLPRVQGLIGALS